MGFAASAYRETAIWQPYGWYRVVPAGDFGGYLYRSPDEYVDFRGPVYQPIAGAAVGLPVADASGRVPMDDVPLWTDEWAAQIVRNRQAAGIAPDRLASAPRRAEEPPRPTFRVPVVPPPMNRGPARPRGEMRPIPNPPAAPGASSKSPVPAPAAHDSSQAAAGAHDAPAISEMPKASSSAPVPPKAHRDETKAPAEDADVLYLEATSDEPAAAPVTAHDERIEPVRSAPAAVAAPDAPSPEALHRATAAGISIGRGDMAFEQGAYEQARDEYAHALEVSGDEPGLRIALGLAEYALGAFDEAAVAIRRGAARAPELTTSDFRLQNVYGRTEDILAHQQALYDHVDENPEDADALFLLGFVQYFSGDAAAARNTLGAYRSVVAHDELADGFIEAVMGAGE